MTPLQQYFFYSFEFVVETLWCEHLNETSSVALSRDTLVSINLIVTKTFSSTFTCTICFILYIFWFILLFCLMLDPPESRQQLSYLFPEREIAELGEVISPRKRDIQISEVKAFESNNFSSVF